MHACHIRLGVIRRSRGESLLHSAAYAMCELVYDIHGRKRDYREAREHHRGTTVLLPRHADRSLAEPHKLILTATSRENRCDAQEGRTVVLSLPRAVPIQLAAVVTAYAIAPMVERGMVAQVDIHEPAASDGERHPHAHIWLSQRTVEGGEFGPKAREWNRLFVGNAPTVRAEIAARMTQAMAMLGIADTVDPRPSKSRGLPPPEQRLPRSAFRQAERGKLREPLRRVQAQRTVPRQPTRPVSQPAIRPVVAPVRERVLIPYPREGGAIIRTGRAVSARGEGTISNLDTAWLIRLVDGSEIVASPHFVRATPRARTPLTTAVMVELATAMGWSGVIVDGPDIFAAEVVQAALEAGSNVMPVNRRLEPSAAAEIGARNTDRLVDAVAWMDPTGALADSIAAYLNEGNSRPASNVAAAAETKLLEAAEIDPEPILIEDFPMPASMPARPQPDSVGAVLWRNYCIHLAEIAQGALALPPIVVRPTAGRLPAAPD